MPRPCPIQQFTIHSTVALSDRLCEGLALVIWVDGAEVGCVRRDDLPEAVCTFLQQVDPPTYEAKEERYRLKEQGLHFDGTWMPSAIRQVLGILGQASGDSLKSGESWLFQERVAAKNGALISLYEITRSGWGFTVRGLEQQEVICEFEALLKLLHGC